MFRLRVLAVAVMTTWSASAWAQAEPNPNPNPNQGEVGESCRARVDCRVGLKCIDNTCVQSAEPPPVTTAPVPPVPAPAPAPAPAPVPPPLTQPAPQPPAPPPHPYALPYPAPNAEPEYYGAPPPLDAMERDWMDFTLDDEVHFYAGTSFYPGFMFVYDSAGASTVQGSFMWAVKAGVFFGNTVLELEIAPVTWVPVLDVGTSIFQMNLGLGTYNRLTDHIFWPTRFGLGFAAVNTTEQFLARADMLGLAFNVGHVMIDFHFPSIRTTTDFSSFGTFNFLFGVSGGYVF